MSARIIITDSDHEDISVESSVFLSAGISDFRLEHCRSEEDVISTCQSAEVLLNFRAPMTGRVIRALPKLRCIVRFGVGYDNVDLSAAAACGVKVCNVPDYCTDEVADHALALLLDLLRGVTRADAAVRDDLWDPRLCRPLPRIGDHTIGLYGCGRIGTAIARRLRPFGCRITACSGSGSSLKRLKSDPSLSFIKTAAPAEVIAGADALILCCSLNHTNRGFFNRGVFAQMKDGACLINIARGGLINEADLAAALESGKFAGAAIDVACTEPLPLNSPLRGAPGLIITPHMAWYTEEADIELNRKSAEEGVRALQGQPLRCQVI